MKLRERIRQYNAFLAITIVTILIWIGATMSDVNSYPASYRVVWAGYDTARYALVSCDSLLPVNLKTNGFRALGRSVSHKERHVELDLSSRIPKHHSETFTVGVRTNEDVYRLINQLHLHGVQGVDFPVDSLHVTLSERQKKAFVPIVRGADFTFAPQHGIMGSVELIPDTVFLYGSALSLNKIEALYTQPATIANISRTDTVRLALEPVWKKYKDVYPSTQSVLVRIPVGKYVENKYVIPVKLRGVEEGNHYKLYPEKVEVEFWVPGNCYDQTKITDFVAEATFDEAASQGEIPVFVSQFPGYSRIKKVTPEYVRCVVIK